MIPDNKQKEYAVVREHRDQRQLWEWLLNSIMNNNSEITNPRKMFAPSRFYNIKYWFKLTP